MKKILLYSGLLLLLTCAKEDSQTPNNQPSTIVPKYTLTASAGEGGSVSPSTGSFNAGTQVSVTATPNSGYQFTSWSNGSTGNPVTVTLNSNTSITANFEVLINSYTLTVVSTDGGSVTGAGEYNEGTEVTLTATSSDGYRFTGWSDGSTEESITIILNSDTALTANFELIVIYNLVLESETGGSVTGAGEYEEGTEVTITAIPDDGYEFIGWSDGESSQSRIITLNSDTNLSADFYIKLYNYERYSAINETTNVFQKQKYFYRYLSKNEYKALAFHSIQNDGSFTSCLHAAPPSQGGCYGTWPYFAVHGSYDTWGDFNNDGKIDYFASTWTFTQDNKFGNEKSPFILISDYFTESNRTYSAKMSEYINWAAPTSIADFDQNGYLDILFLHNNRHNNSVNWDPNQITANSGENISPGQSSIVFFEPNGDFTEVPFGPSDLDTHTSSSGDIDNDGDIDIIMFPWQVQGAGLSPSPKIILNNGGRNFQTIELLNDYSQFVNKHPYNWNNLMFNLFDLDGDGNLDIVGGKNLREIPDWEVTSDSGVLYWQYWEDYQKGFHSNNRPWILWGTDDVQFNSDNIVSLEKNIFRHIKSNILGSGFTDYDNDGDIDIIIISTVTTSESGDIFYKNYELTLYENKGNRVFEDVTQQKIEGYYNMDSEKYGEFYFIAMIDKDNDGDFDIVPYGAGNSFGQTIEEQFITNLYWENTGGQFVRREYNYD